MYWLCRGIDHEPVRPRQLQKSVGCSKNFWGKEMLTSKSDVSLNCLIWSLIYFVNIVKTTSTPDYVLLNSTLELSLGHKI